MIIFSRSIPRPFFALCVAIFMSVALSARLSAAPRLSPDPRIPDAADYSAPLDAEDFARLALVASGTDADRIDGLTAQLHALRDELSSRLPAGADGHARAEAALALLYERTLSRYSLLQTRLDTALLTGEYNCVSSAILFCYLAKTAGLAVGAVETPDHAFCTVELDGVTIDVETTNPYGVDPGRQKEIPTAQAAQKRYVLVPQTKYRNRKAVSDRRLIALVYNNRISALERKGGYEESVGLAVDAWKLQGGSMSAEDIPARCINYAVSLSRSGDDPGALAFIADVRARWGDDPRYGEYVASAVGSMLNALMKRDAYPDAFALLSAQASAIPPNLFPQMERGVALNYLRYCAETESFADARGKILAARDTLSAADYESALAYAYYKEADRVSAGGEWLKGAAVADEGLREIPGQRDLAQQRSVYRQNYAVEVHNRAAAAWNAGRKAEARTLLEEGLSRVPESALLKNDLSRFRQGGS